MQLQLINSCSDLLLFKQYGAITIFHINDDAKEEALNRSYFVLQRSGDRVHAENCDHLTAL